MSLYRKYRPQDFENLIGQEHIKTTLLNAIKEGKISHAYLFCGPRGTGKTTTARLIAKAINCQNPLPSGHHCNECMTCKSALDGSLVDLIEIDAASNRGIDEIRDLREKIRFVPSVAKAKVYIIDEVHMLTKEAFNALLKTLEEPPSHAYFILATTETHKVPATIISRCQRFDFRRIGETNLIDRLKFICENENLKYEPAALHLISSSVKGGLRDAISILDQLSSFGDISKENVNKTLGLGEYVAVENLFNALITNDRQSAIATISVVYEQGVDLMEFTKQFLEYLRKVMIDSVNGLQNIDSKKLIKIIESFIEARQKINLSIIPTLPLEIAVIQSTEILFEKILPAKPIKIDDPVISNQPLEDKKPEKAAIQEKTKPEDNVHSVLTENTNFVDILKKIPDLIASLNSPSLQQIVKQGAFKQGGEDEVIIEFNSNFHFEQFNKAEHVFNLEQAIKKMFNLNAKVIGQVNKMKSNEKIITNNVSSKENMMNIFTEDW